MARFSALWRRSISLLIAFAAVCGCRPASLTIEFGPGEKPSDIRIVGLPQEVLHAMQAADIAETDWQQFFVVRVDTPEASPMFGKYRVEQDLLTFTPSFPLREGLNYRAVFDPAALQSVLGEKLSGATYALPGTRIATTIALASRPAPATKVTAVYPTSDVLPENQLKFYIHFSAPMRRGESYQHVKLMKSTGEEVPIPFLELSEELWDGDGQRFTLIFEPGRVKRGLMLREEIGPALVEGGEYELVIDQAWRDARGNPLGESFRKRFRVGPQDATQPDPKQWKLTPPKAGTRDDLVVEFNEPLDRAMLDRVLRVVEVSGNEKSGEVSVGSQETRWSFTPDDPWSAGRNELVVAAVLEDLAGNSVGRKFEVRMEDKDRELIKEFRVPFEVRP